jgi:hypothetical protein
LLTEEISRLNRSRLLRGEAFVDPFLDRPKEDDRRCLMLLARLPATLHPLSEIDRFCRPEQTMHFRTFKVGSG